MSTDANLPEFVTLTGIDDATDLDRLVAISSRWSVEWGVLFSRKLSGHHPRYPSLGLGDRLASLPVRRAAHLCGRWARDFLDDYLPLDPELVAILDGRYDRIQVNVPDGEDLVRHGPVADLAERMARRAGSLGARRAILQCRGRTFPDFPEIDWLYDASGGRGVAAERWPDASSRGPSLRAGRGPRIGYAGGIGPSTVADVVHRLSRSHANGTPYWIDMETGLRDVSDRMDIRLCEETCLAIWGPR